jgi:hypothetical protein
MTLTKELNKKAPWFMAMLIAVLKYYFLFA